MLEAYLARAYLPLDERARGTARPLRVRRPRARRGVARAARAVRVPQRGPRRELVDLAEQNARHLLEEFRLAGDETEERAGDPVYELQRELGLAERAARARLLRHLARAGDGHRRVVRLVPERAPVARRVPEVQGEDGGGDRRLRVDERGGDALLHAPRRGGEAAPRSRAHRRRQGAAQRRARGARRARSRRDADRQPREARRGDLRARPRRVAAPLAALAGAPPAAAGARRGAPLRDHLTAEAPRDAHGHVGAAAHLPASATAKRRALLRAFGSLQGVRGASAEEIARAPRLRRRRARERILDALQTPRCAGAPRAPEPTTAND